MNNTSIIQVGDKLLVVERNSRIVHIGNEIWVDESAYNEMISQGFSLY
jgi:hypothetical protein